MEDTDLDELLAELSAEIERTESANDAEQDSLRRLDADIQRLLKRSHKERRAEPEMLEEWESSVEELEAEHPTLTRLISQVLNALSNVGI
jgi:iron-sulfur cluster repair protein YtfE (RIC family)